MKSAEEVVYEQAQRSLTHQAQSVDELRSRTGLVLVAIGVFGGLIGNAADDSGLGAFGGLAVVALACGAFLCISLLLPSHESWTFTVDARTLIEEHLDVPQRNDAAKLMRFLADHFQGYYQGNADRLELRYFRLWCACVSLSVALGLWVLELVVD